VEVMKISDVKVGMRLRCTVSDAPSSGPVTVTEITERGFKYKLNAPVCVHPRRGITVAAEGHEHYGFNGEAFYEPICDAPSADEMG
jgi:hypothetical protein